ncbi:MAG: DUF459 domain-containing protein [Deltaproteobacteria bacterium]|nr:DUF459 domain-containing protein [Deltaproteobacteria bacterium]
MGRYVDKYRPIEIEPKTVSNPLACVLGLWIAFAVMCLYGADSLYADVALDDRVRGRSILLPLVEANRLAADTLGLTDLNARLGWVAQSIGSTPVFLAEEDLLASATGDAGPGDSSPSDAGPSDAGPGDAGSGDAGPDVTAPGDGAAQPPEPPEKAASASAGVWQPENGLPVPKRVLLIGASSIQYYLGADLERKLEGFEGLRVHRLGKLSTGLTRPDVFDWPAKLTELKKKLEPDLVIALFGGNDCQPIKAGDKVLDFATAGWNAVYRERLGRFIELMKAGGSSAVILGLPTMRSKRFSSRLKKLNALLSEGARQHGAIFVSTWDLSSDSQGRYLKTLNYKGKTALMRLKDGIHYSRHGSQYVSEKLVARLQRHFNLVSRQRELALAARFELVSKARGGERTPYLAFVPQGTRAELPVLFLLHGRDGSYTDWSEHAHEKLQRLSSEHQLVIVAPDGRPRGWYLDSPVELDSMIESWFFQELLPHTMNKLPVGALRGIAGLSMGGHGALVLALRHRGQIRSASSMSGVLDLSALRTRKDLVRLLGPWKKHRSRWESVSALQIVRSGPATARGLPMLVTVGRKDRFLKVNRTFHRLLAARGIAHVYRESAGGHSWSHWTSVLDGHVAFHAQKLGAGDIAHAARSPLHLAAELGQLDKLAHLVARPDMDLDARNADNDTPLHLAAGRGHTKVAAWLIDRKVDIAARNATGATALHEAARQGQVATLRLLIRKKAPLDARDARGRTALHWAARYGFTEAAEWLLIAGADYTLRDADGKRAGELGPIFTRGRIEQLIEQAKKRQAAKKKRRRPRKKTRPGSRRTPGTKLKPGQGPGKRTKPKPGERAELDGKSKTGSAD